MDFYLKKKKSYSEPTEPTVKIGIPLRKDRILEFRAHPLGFPLTHTVTSPNNPLDTTQSLLRFWGTPVCRFIIYGLHYAEVGSYYAHVLKNFNHKSVLNFVKVFFCIYWDYHMVFIFQLLIWCITLIYLHILKNPYIPRINPNLIIVYELFDVLLNSVC